MADKAFQTPQLSPRHVISALAHRADPAQLEALQPMLEPGQDGWSLIWRNTSRLRAASIALAEALDLSETNLREVREADRVGDLTRKPGNEMIRYLIWRDFSNEPDAVALPGQHLMVVPQIDRSALIDLLDRLNRHATCIRAAVLNQARGDEITLFHLRGDDQRGSTLRAFLAAYRGLPVPILNAYHTTSGTAFLPVAPPAQSLAAVARMIANAPSLFAGLTEPRLGWAPEALLFAVASADDLPGGNTRNSDTFYDIRSERFFGSAAFTTETQKPVLHFAQSVMEPSAAAETLKRQLMTPDGDFAAKLNLRDVKSSVLANQNPAQLATLEAEKRVLNRKIRAVEARSAGQSAIIVAPDMAFPALATLLRQIVASDETWDTVRYAYLSRSPGSAQDPARDVPHHVFHFGPRLAQLARLNASLARYKDVKFYWSDPGWAATYGASAQIEIITPVGQRLTPLPHSWSANEMDEYLIDMVKTWSDGAITLQPGARHVLQFTDTSDDGKLGLEVYDAQTLYPLQGRTITWFNTVLAQIGAAQADDLRLDMENTEARAALAQARADREASLDAEISAATQQAQTDVAKAWSGFGHALEVDLDQRMQGMAERAKTIASIEAQAEALETELTKANALLEQMKKDAGAFAKDQTFKAVSQTGDIKNFLGGVNERSIQFDRSVAQSEKKINDMGETLKRLRKFWF